MHQHSVASAIAVLLAAAPTAWAAGMYTKQSPVLQVDAKSYDRLITKSNHTSIVEFYAPWCGHCQNLKPIYERAAGMLDGLVKVAAVDCDDDANKQLCGALGIKGFPTLKIVRPGTRPGRPVVEDYNGARTAPAIAEAVTQKINNHVQRVADKDLDAFLAKTDGPKAILFTEKGVTSALLRSIAIDYLGVISVAQIRNKETAAVAKFGIEKFPTLVLIPAGEGEEPVIYDGELKKDAMIKFLRQAGEPNPDPAPVKAKAKGDKKGKESKPKAEKAEKPKAEQPKADHETTADTPPAASTPKVHIIPTASTKQEVADKCLQPKSHTCVLALIPGAETDDSKKVTDSLTQLNTKYIQGGRQVFPFFAIPDSVQDLSAIRENLETKSAVELVAINARRNWWRKYEGDFAAAGVEAWMDAIRMGEGTKMKLPKGIVEDVEEPREPEESVVEEPEVEEPVAEDEPEAEMAGDHDEL